MNKKTNISHYPFESKKVPDSKIAPSSFAYNKFPTKINQKKTLNKSQTKKLGTTAIINSLSIKKVQDKELSAHLMDQKEGKKNPETKICGQTLHKTSSTQRFMVRNALYMKQKSLKLQNQRRNQLYGVVAECKFQPQLEKASLKQSQKLQKSNPPSDASIFAEQKIENLGKYQYNYRKKLQYEQFGYTKKNIGKGTSNKSVKQLLKQSVQRFNLKLKHQQTQQDEQQLLPSKKIIFIQDGKYVGDTLDTHKNLIWITNEAEKKDAQEEIKGDLFRQGTENQSFNLNIKVEQQQKQEQLMALIPNSSFVDKNQKSNEFFTQNNINKLNQVEVQLNKTIFDKKGYMNDMNDISDIIKKQDSLNQSDFFNSQFKNKDLDFGRDSGEDWFPKAFKKQQNKGEEEAKKESIHEQQQEQKSKEIIEIDQFSYKDQAASMQKSLISEGYMNQKVEESLSQKLQDLKTQVKEPQNESKVQVNEEHGQEAKEEKKEEQMEQINLAFEVHIQTEINCQMCTFSFLQLQHFTVADLTLEPLKKKSDEIPICETLKQIVEKKVEITQLIVENQDKKLEKSQDRTQQELRYEQVKQQEEDQLQLLKKQQNYQDTQQSQPYIVDDYGNVIQKNKIQIYSVGLCKILIIPELSEQQSRGSYS